MELRKSHIFTRAPYQHQRNGPEKRQRENKIFKWKEKKAKEKFSLFLYNGGWWKWRHWGLMSWMGLKNFELEQFQD